MLEILDALIATAAVILGLSLIAQAIQQIIKQWLDLKSNYMRFQLLAMFGSTVMPQPVRALGLRTVTSLARSADESAQLIVTEIEKVLQSFGYKNLELLENFNPAKLKKNCRDNRLGEDSGRVPIPA